MVLILKPKFKVYQGDKGNYLITQITGGFMSPSRLKRSNICMKRFEQIEKRLIKYIDKKAKKTVDSTMNKHLIGESKDGCRIWRF